MALKAMSWMMIVLLFFAFSILGYLVEKYVFERQSFAGVETFMIRKVTGLDPRDSKPLDYVINHTVLAWGFVFLLIYAAQRLGASPLLAALIATILIPLNSCLFIGRDVLKLHQDPMTKVQRSDPFAIGFCNNYETFTNIPLYFGGAFAMGWVVQSLAE